MSDEDKKRYEMLLKSLTSGSRSFFTNELGVLPSDVLSSSSVVESPTVTLAEPVLNEGFEIMVENKYVGKLIGSGGSRIQKIREESGATINISGRHVDKKRIVKITGKEMSIKIAKEQIMKYITVK
jgi:hypothetical protein